MKEPASKAASQALDEEFSLVQMLIEPASGRVSRRPN
jgi:hypothetical protein